MFHSKLVTVCPRGTFSAPLAETTGTTVTKIPDTVSVTDLDRRINFQPNSFSSFGGDGNQTDRQTRKQTANLI